MDRKLPVVVLSLLLTACATPVSVDDLRRVNEGSATIVAELPYEIAYRIIAAESRRCFERQMAGVNINVNADLYNESKTGEIAVSGALATRVIAEIVFDIRSTGPVTSEIKAYYRKKSTESVVAAMRNWLKGDKTSCGN